MSKKKQNVMPAETADAAEYKPVKRSKGWFGRLIRRFFLLILTVIVMVVGGLYLLLDTIFDGPSPAAKKILTMSLLEPSGTKWVPGLFLDEDEMNEITNVAEATLPNEVSDTNHVVIKNDGFSDTVDEFADYPDGVYIESISGDTYNASVMLIQDPSRVFMGTCRDPFSTSVPGKRLTDAMEEAGDSVVAALNAGAFYDDATAGKIVGSVPAGLVLANGKVVWNDYHDKVPQKGFVGFTEDDILVVSKSMTTAKAKELKIRDGCEFGPVLVMDGQPSEETYNTSSGWNPRSAIGQRADGTVILVAVEGRQVGSPGATFVDLINIMVEYGAVNACNLDGGSSTVMLYRDTYGRYGQAGQVVMMNNYSLLQTEPRRMPNYWMVRAKSEE